MSGENRMSWIRDAHGMALLRAVFAEPRNNNQITGSLAKARTFLLILDQRTVRSDPEPLGAAETRIVEQSVDEFLSRYRAADPSRTGTCTQWLVRRALDGRMPLEDLGKAKETLEAFLTYKRRLPVEARDLGQYESLGAVWKAVEPFVLEKRPTSTREEERRERDAARAESTILLEEEGWIVAIPETERAAKWWGRGTRWCTAAEQNNIYQSYATDGPLVVLVRPDGAKLQFHAASGQFMDAADKYVDQKDIQSFVERFANDIPGLAAAIQMEAQSDEYRSRDFWLAPSPIVLKGIDQSALRSAVADFGTPLRRAKEAFSAKARRKKAHDATWEDFLTEDLTLAAVQRNPQQFKEIPNALRTQALADAAMRDPTMLQHIDPRLRTRDLCLAAARNCDSPMLQLVPKAIIDEEICLIAASSSGDNLGHVPRKFLTRAVCAAAVAQNPEALAWVPPDHLVDDIVIPAQKAVGSALQRLDQKSRTDARIDAALESDPRVLYILSENDKTRERCLSAVSKNGLLLELVPQAFRNEEMCRAAVARNGLAILHTPKEFVNEEMITTAIASNPAAIRKIAHTRLTHDMLLEATRRNPNAITHMKRYDAEIALTAVLGRPDIIAHVPKALRTMEVCVAALALAGEQRGALSLHVPEEIRGGVLMAAQRCVKATDGTPSPEDIRRAAEELAAPIRTTTA